jgi:hypothetical protein
MAKKILSRDEGGDRWNGLSRLRNEVFSKMYSGGVEQETRNKEQRKAESPD